jgi:alkylation response protein AidB-like acyl-CoA dehydrogenase
MFFVTFRLTKGLYFLNLFSAYYTHPIFHKDIPMKQMEKEREMIREAAAKTARKVVQPRAAEMDATGEFPWDLVTAFGNQGFLSIIIPEQYGGTNGDIVAFCSAIEEIAKVCGSSSLLILAQGVGTLPILIAGNPSQQERYFIPICEKNHLTAFALTESESGWDATSIRTKAERQGTNYILNGRKCFITNGSVAHLYVVFAATDPGGGTKGISAFVVEQETPGLSFGQKEEKIGMRGSMTTDVIFENCWVPQENRLGEEGEGWMIAMNTLHTSRVAMGAQAVGIAKGALDFTIRYATERIQFGKTIASFQGIQFMIADMATQVEAARALVYQTAADMDTRPEEIEKLSSITKSFASDVAMRVTTDAVQILGGYGYMKDYPIERMMRDAKVTQVYDGSNQAQRLMIAQQLIK